MARKCEICGKKPLYGNSISHAHNVTRKRQLPNLQVVRVTVSGNKKKVKACTQCLRSGKVYSQA